jgi:hypothetical protein
MKKWFVILSAFLLLICVGTLIFVGLNSRSGGNEPLTPEQEKIRDLIAQLGDADWNRQMDATVALKEIGEPALPLLKRVFGSFDNEVRPRARSIARWIEHPPQVPELYTWAHLVAATMESMGLKLEPPPAQVANLNAAPPALPEAQPPAPAMPMPNMGGAQMPNMNLPQMPQMRGGAMPGIGGGLLGGGLGGRGGGAMGGLMGQMQQLMMARMMQQGGARGGGARNIPPPDLSDLSLNLTATVGIRLTEAADGLRVTDVRPGSPAASGGMRVGDLLQKADGRQMTVLADAKEVFEGINPGKTVPIVVLRRDQSLPLSLRF